jgi:hypothetical protein
VTDLQKMNPATPWTCLCLSFLLWAAAPTRPARAEPPRAERGAADAALSAPPNAPTQASAADSAQGSASSADPAPFAAAEAPATPPPAPAPVHKVQVHFSAKRGTLQVEAVGPVPERCTTPCTLLLPPGKTALVISGDARFAQSIAIPDRETSLELSMRRRGRAITGGVFLIVGIVSTAVGCALVPFTTGAAVPLSVGVTGLTAMITGWVLARRAGRDEVRIIDQERPPVAQSKPRGLKLASVGVAPMIAQSGAQLNAHWSF